MTFDEIYAATIEGTELDYDDAEVKKLESVIRSVMESCAKLACNGCFSGIPRIDTEESYYHAMKVGGFFCSANRIWRVLDEAGEQTPDSDAG